MHEREGMQLGFTTDPYLPSKACLNLIKCITLADNLQAVGPLRHAYCPLKAMLLSTKRVRYESQLSEKDHKSLFINEIQKLFILSVFSSRRKVVCKYAQHEEARCQEKSYIRTRIILIRSTCIKRKLKRGYTIWHIPFNLFLYRRKLFFCHQSHGVACDDNLFIGRNHTNRYLGIGGRDDGFLAPNLVGFGIHLHTQEL